LSPEDEKAARGRGNDALDEPEDYESSTTDEIILDEKGETIPDEEPTPSSAAPEEMWIEEYERGDEPEEEERAEEKPRRTGLWILAIVIASLLIIWVILTPSTMSEVGAAYLDDEDYANLGSGTATVDVRVVASMLSVGSVTWGVGIAGDANVTAEDDAVFHVTVMKVSEDGGGFWFKGTWIRLRNVSLFTDADQLVGWMSGYNVTGIGDVARVHATFVEPGAYSCYVSVKFSVYENMLLGFIPADSVVFAEIHLSSQIVVAPHGAPS
jgi:hypothetical protein